MARAKLAKTTTKPAATPAKAPAPPAPKVAVKGADDLLAQYWANPDDLQLLRVWADSLQEHGDPRGEFIQLCLLDKPTPEQIARKTALDRKQRGRLVGPAREYLREFEFADNGLVGRARCEADKLLAGLREIEWLNPRLSLKLTSIKKAIADQLGAISLERIYHVSFVWGVIGSQGGTPMTDAILTRIAPAFRRVRHLALDCSGYADNCFTPEGLRVIGNTCEALEYLAVGYDNGANRPFAQTARGALPPIDDYAKVIASAPGFRTLKVVFLRGANPEILDGLPELVYAETAGRVAPKWWSADHNYGFPATAAELEAVKRGEIPTEN